MAWYMTLRCCHGVLLFTTVDKRLSVRALQNIGSIYSWSGWLARWAQKLSWYSKSGVNMVSTTVPIMNLWILRYVKERGKWVFHFATHYFEMHYIVLVDVYWWLTNSYAKSFCLASVYQSVSIWPQCDRKMRISCIANKSVPCTVVSHVYMCCVYKSLTGLMDVVRMAVHCGDGSIHVCSNLYWSSVCAAKII